MVFVVGGVRIDGLCFWRSEDRWFVVGGVRIDDCCWRCKDRWCLLLECKDRGCLLLKV